MYTIENHESNLIKENHITYGSKVTQDSLLITHNYDLTYQAKIIGQNTITYAKEDPLTVMKVSCLNNFTSYDGQRQAVNHYFGYKQKLPIPLLLDKIYLFPTKSPSQLDCMWINYNKLEHLEKKAKGSRLYFTGSIYLDLAESYRTIRTQIQRTQEIAAAIEDRSPSFYFF